MDACQSRIRPQAQKWKVCGGHVFNFSESFQGSSGNYFTYEAGPSPRISAPKRSMQFHSLITHFVNMFLVGLYAAVIASVECNCVTRRSPDIPCYRYPIYPAIPCYRYPNDLDLCIPLTDHIRRPCNTVLTIYPIFSLSPRFPFLSIFPCHPCISLKALPPCPNRLGSYSCLVQTANEC